jgi:aryl-alcohol dehydrogenase (NADP+)
LTANLAALDVTLTAEQIATLDAVSKPVLSFPAGYAQISQMFGFPGTTIDGVQTPPSPTLAASAARY